MNPNIPALLPAPIYVGASPAGVDYVARREGEELILLHRLACRWHGYAVRTEKPDAMREARVYREQYYATAKAWGAYHV